MTLQQRLAADGGSSIQWGGAEVNRTIYWPPSVYIMPALQRASISTLPHAARRGGVFYETTQAEALRST